MDLLNIFIKKDTVLYHSSAIPLNGLVDKLLYTTCGSSYGNEYTYKITIKQNITLLNLVKDKGTEGDCHGLQLYSLVSKVIFCDSDHENDVRYKQKYSVKILKYLRDNSISGFMAPIQSSSCGLEFVIDPQYCNIELKPYLREFDEYENAILDKNIMIKKNINCPERLFKKLKGDFEPMIHNYIYLIIHNKMIV
mgnify:CR=1 FL=1